MKKRQLIIRGILLISLVSILGLLSILYLAFCRDGSYNSAPIESATTKVETEIEQTTSVPENEETTLESEDNIEETEPSKPIIGENYNPIDELAGENWSLTLINKNHPLDKHYTPNRAAVIDGVSVTADARVAENYKKMYDAALAENIILTPFSGYCDYQRQKTLFNDKVSAFKLQGQSDVEAKQNAERRVGSPGCSENGAGLAVDIISASAGFSSTNEYTWLVNNAHNYGFVLRYPEDKTEITGIIYQPWHWRYVGVEAATEMKEKNLCLEEYLGQV